MAKKKSRQQPGKMAHLGNLSLAELMARGDGFFLQQKFAEALLCFKQAMKLEATTEVEQKLKQAYLGRIASLASKSLIKEALVMLENMAERCPGSDTDELKLYLLLQAGCYRPAAALFCALAGRLPPARVVRLESIFSALLLAGADLPLADLPLDSQVVAHFPLALAAVEAVVTGAEKMATDSLKQIPFRSPYRDLRTLLAGWVMARQDAEKANALLEKIGNDSPYFRFAGRLANRPKAAASLFKELLDTKKEEQSRFRERYDLSYAESAALQDLAHTDSRPQCLYRIVNKHASCFSREQKSQLLKNISNCSPPL